MSSMDEKKKKEEPKIYADGKAFPEKPGLMDQFTEAFQPTATRVDLEAIRKRRRAASGV